MRKIFYGKKLGENIISYTYGIAFSFTSCLGLTVRTFVLPELVELEVMMTWVGCVGRELMCEITFCKEVLECVVMIGDTGCNGILGAVKLEELEC